MHWELWSIDTANLVGTFDTESEGLALVRELVGKGWPIDTLSLMVEDESRPIATLPPAVWGDDLLRRANAAATDAARRTA